MNIVQNQIPTPSYRETLEGTSTVYRPKQIAAEGDVAPDQVGELPYAEVVENEGIMRYPHMIVSASEWLDLRARKAIIATALYLDTIKVISGKSEINIYNQMVPISAAAQIDLGSDADYFDDVYADDFVNKSVSSFEGKDCLKMLKDIKASQEINPKTNLPFLDKKSFPKEIYKSSPKASENIYARDIKGKKYLKFKKGEPMSDREGSISIAQTIGLLLGAVKQLSLEVEQLKVKAS